MKVSIKTKLNFKRIWLSLLSMVIILFVSHEAAAADATFGTMAESMTKSFENIGKLITGGSYVAGLAFAIGAIMKFKQHKDNPTQVPVGTPIALVFIAASLLFLPTLLGVTGQTMFGQKPQTAGPAGTEIK